MPQERDGDIAAWARKASAEGTKDRERRRAGWMSPGYLLKADQKQEAVPQTLELNPRRKKGEENR